MTPAALGDELVELLTTRHLPGLHDQKSHGKWAAAKKAAKAAAAAASADPPKKAPRKKSAVKKPKRPTRAEIKAAEEHAHGLGMSKSVAWAHRQEVARELTRQARLAPRSMRQLDAVNLPKRDSEDAQAFLDSKNGRALAYYSPLGSHPSVYATEHATADNPKPAIWLSPVWHGDHGIGPASYSKHRGQKSGFFVPSGAESKMEATLAHEFGHHVSKVFFGEINIDGTAEMHVEIGLRFLPVLNDALGANRYAQGLTMRPDGDMLAPQMLGSAGNLRPKLHGGVLDNWVYHNKDLITEKVSGYAATNMGELLAEVWEEYSTKGADARPHIKVIGDAMREIAEEVRA